MTKYHISSDGVPNPCSADKKPCPLGADEPHFETKEAAREHYEKSKASKAIAKPLTKNNPSDNDLASLKSDKELEKLSKDRDPNVRARVALIAPAHILEKLSKDKNPMVRNRVGRNPNAPAHILEKLSKDKDSAVRIGVAWNRNAPLHVLEKLSQEKDLRVRTTASKTLDRLFRSTV